MRLLLVVVCALGAGLTVAVDPRIGLAAGVLVSGAIALALVSARLADVALGACAALLIGYAFFGRGFAYLGVAPLFVGELVLLLLVLGWLRGPRDRLAGAVPPLLVAFMVWGAISTVPYLGTYGLDALRDAVTWGYGLFALAVASTLRTSHVRAAAGLYARILPAFLLWVPLAGILTRIVEIPNLPGTTVPIVVFKGGDAGVLLGGVAAFVMVGLYERMRPSFRMPEALLWAGWLIAVGVVGTVNRGGLIAASMMAITVVSLRAAARWIVLVSVALALLVPLAIIDPRIDVGGAREVSIGQIAENVTSVFTSTEDDALEGTERFRLAWWRAIVDYTVSGPYFWTGKGYGINLADDDGFQPTEDGSLRAPHNGHVEVLARSGVPGLMLWVMLQVTFGATLLRTLGRARRLPDPWWSQIIAWVLTIWLAALVNSTFDPYLQGPHGGIWFWSIFGLGIAATRLATAELEEAPAGGGPIVDPATRPGPAAARRALRHSWGPQRRAQEGPSTGPRRA